MSQTKTPKAGDYLSMTFGTLIAALVPATALMSPLYIIVIVFAVTAPSIIPSMQSSVVMLVLIGLTMALTCFFHAKYWGDYLIDKYVGWRYWASESLSKYITILWGTGFLVGLTVSVCMEILSPLTGVAPLAGRIIGILYGLGFVVLGYPAGAKNE